jgi:hypothetical protein
MQDWHSTYLGPRTLPRELSAFEIEAFFNFSLSPRRPPKFFHLSTGNIPSVPASIAISNRFVQNCWRPV